MDQDKIKLFEDQPIRTAWDAGYSIELVYDPGLIEAAAENSQVIELPDTDFVLLSEEDVEKELDNDTLQAA